GCIVIERPWSLRKSSLFFLAQRHRSDCPLSAYTTLFRSEQQGYHLWTPFLKNMTGAEEHSDWKLMAMRRTIETRFSELCRLFNRSEERRVGNKSINRYRRSSRKKQHKQCMR